MPVGWNWKNSMSSSGTRGGPAAPARPGVGVGVGGGSEHLPEPPGGEKQGLGPENVQLAGFQLQGHQARGPTAFQQHVQNLELVEEGDFVLDALL